MKLFATASLVASLFAGSLFAVACAVAPDEPEGAGLADEVALTEEASLVDPGPLTLHSLDYTCQATRNCIGTKTCTPWTSFAACGDSFYECSTRCGFITRSGCVAGGTFEPQNRTRSCVMRATGQTCVEVDYRLRTLSCPGGD